MKRIGLAVVVMASMGCSMAASEPTGASEEEIRLEQAPTATALTELRAGQPYVPGVDEAPLAIGEPCIKGPKVTISPGQVGSSAAVVQSRQSLSRELGFGISGVIPVAGGLTGAAGLTVNTTFDNQSAVVLFQSTGTYESALSGADAMPNFDAAAVARCGYGYVTRANHRVTAALVVTVRATSNGNDVKANASLGKTGVAEAKVSVSNLIKRGQVEISIRYATDVIPNLPAAPLADSALVVGDSDQEKARAVEKLERSLTWLASAQSAIETYLLDLRNRPDQAPPAPTQSLRFRFYPSTPQSVRTSVESAVDSAIAARTGLAETNASIEAWEGFGAAQREARGHEWNIAAAPAGSAAELDAVRRRLLEENGGILLNHRRKLEDGFDACAMTLRNEEGRSADGLRNALRTACAMPPAFPVDARTHDVRPIAILSVDEMVNGGRSCPAGQRMPTEAETPLFAGWSRALKGSDRGIWLADGHCTWTSAWIYDGAATCTPVFKTSRGLRICVSAAQGPMPAL